ncbi:anthranilate synthase component I [Petroclostridium sp. X23]|uniref:anthranilate synthase component I n=1 Tax=Petroclostridium sp. X23 TaxID=3045146 RepID=UPI0024AD118D|nr:anthranilate synthase component I [Petroclostridium sp. X23]WHH59602.1 anthranilate synthase component I [Petroclostridium sp. X23]
MYYPSHEQYMIYSENSKVIPVSCEISADMETPISIYKKFSTEQYSYLFESVEGGERWARYSFVGRKPFIIFKTMEGLTTIQIQNEKLEYNENPFSVLQKLLDSFKSQTFHNLPRFYGGVVGYFGYDMIRCYEDIKDENPDELGIPDCHLMVPEEVIVFDHLKQKIHIIVNTFPSKQQNPYEEALKKIGHIINELASVKFNSKTSDTHQIVNNEEYSFSVTKEEFCNNVLKAKEYIRNGDIFQVVLSQRLRKKFDGDPFDVYRTLRTLNPSPYMYFLKFEDYAIAGASPEMLVRVENGIVETCPIAGTRPRGKTPEEDKRFEEDLLRDEKERAEHTMLVDLGRNDIGRVCTFGSVKAKNIMHVERYSHVMHMVTNVEGKKAEDKSPLEVLTSVLPAGTVSGAPKVRAMEIIEEIENIRRNVYAGAIGYIGFDGNLDTCIAIRTAVFKNGKVYIQAGGGIVTDSVPENEYEESINKAKALVNAVKKAGEIK